MDSAAERSAVMAAGPGHLQPWTVVKDREDISVNADAARWKTTSAIPGHLDELCSQVESV